MQAAFFQMRLPPLAGYLSAAVRAAQNDKNFSGCGRRWGVACVALPGPEADVAWIDVGGSHSLDKGGATLGK